jgi:hypothetical protein
LRIEPFQWVAGDVGKKIAPPLWLALQVVGQRFKQQWLLVFPLVCRRARKEISHSKHAAQISDFVKKIRDSCNVRRW